MKSDSVFEILAEPILSSMKVYGKKVGLILNIKVNHGLDKFGLRVVVHYGRPPRQYSIGLEDTEMLGKEIKFIHLGNERNQFVDALVTLASMARVDLGQNLQPIHIDIRR